MTDKEYAAQLEANEAEIKQREEKMQELLKEMEFHMNEVRRLEKEQESVITKFAEIKEAIEELQKLK